MPFNSRWHYSSVYIIKQQYKREKTICEEHNLLSLPTRAGFVRQAWTIRHEHHNVMSPIRQNHDSKNKIISHAFYL
jgi:hypothetical protein